MYKHLLKLNSDIYPQPEDEGHSEMAAEVINLWRDYIKDEYKTLDVGCGQGFCSKYFKNWTGITLGADYQICKSKKLNVFEMDMTDIKFPDDSFDLIFARHVLEHSPMPIITLMEWHRVADLLLLVLPNPEHFGYFGRNHYSVMNDDQIKWLCSRAGWQIISENKTDKELRYFAVNNKPRKFGPYDKHEYDLTEKEHNEKLT